MASLTEAQKVSIRRHLGFHSVSQSFYPLIEGFYSIDSILNDLDVTPDTIDAAVVILDRLDALEARIDKASSHLEIEQVEDIKFRGPVGSDALWSELRRWRRELSTLIGIPMRHGTPSFVVT